MEVLGEDKSTELESQSDLAIPISTNMDCFWWPCEGTGLHYYRYHTSHVHDGQNKAAYIYICMTWVPCRCKSRIPYEAENGLQNFIVYPV